MSITRKPLDREQPFTVFANDLLNDESLSAEALGVLVYLLSKPGNWRVLPGPLGRRFGCGRDKIYRIMNELIAAGYASRYQERDGGTFSDQNFLVSNDKAPLTENPEAAKPEAADPHQQKKDPKKGKKDDSYSEDFEAIWKQYPRTKNTSKKDAWNFYRMMSDEKQEQVRRAVPAFAAAMRAEGRTEDKIMHMIRFLRGGVYETVASPPIAPAAGGSAKPWWETASRQDWINALFLWQTNWNWKKMWGPEPENPMRPNPPGAPKHHVPQDILDRFDLRYRGAMYSPEQKAEIQARVDAASKHAVDSGGAA